MEFKTHRRNLRKEFDDFDGVICKEVVQHKLVDVSKETVTVIPEAEEPQHQGVSEEELQSALLLRILRPFHLAVLFFELQSKFNIFEF